MNARLINRVSRLLGGLLAFVFFSAGFSKLAGAGLCTHQFEQWGYPDEMRYVVGLLEVGLAIGLLWPGFRLIALYEIFFWAGGAVLTHAQVGEWERAGVPLLLVGLNAVLLLIECNRGDQFTEADRRLIKSLAKR